LTDGVLRRLDTACFGTRFFFVRRWRSGYRRLSRRRHRNWV